eukprot:g8669.t1
MRARVFRASALRKLGLSNNALSSLPEFLGNLHTLKLTLSHNPLSSLPALVGNLKNLGELSLINCTLRALPESLGNLQSLLRLGRYREVTSMALRENKGLDLSNNVLNSLPEYVGSLKNLRHLELQNNHLSSVPFSFGNLSSLEKLDLSNNKLSALPGSFHKLTNLKHLYLQHNNLTSFFNTSGKNLQLEVLLLNDNQLSNDLLAFCGLKNASTLYLHQNRLGGQIPGMIAELNSIQVLTLHRNSLTGKIPSELATLPSLQLLTLHENRLTGEIPPSFSVRNASALVFLSAFSNDLTGSVPEMTLRGGCVDDQSFRMEAAWKKRDASVTSTISCARKDELDNFDLTSEERQQIQDACPNVKLAMWFSKRSRVPRSMLLMAARTGTMWLNATLCAIYMNEHCVRGWTTFWPMCDPESDLYRNFKVSLGRHPLLDPIRDLCARNDRWWTTDESWTVEKAGGWRCICP